MSDRFETKMRQARKLMAEHLGLPALPKELQLCETVPPLDQTVLDFCRAADIEPPVRLDVTPSAGAEAGLCIVNVRRAVEERGGTINFGWLIWGAPDLFYEAEFHAVHRDRDGRLVDVTPTHDGETEILYSPDARLAASFDFMQRPGNKRIKVYRREDLDVRIAERLAAMNDASMRYASERARRKGMQLRDWLAMRLDPDDFDLAIDRFIELGNKIDTMFQPSEKGTVLRKGVSRTEFDRTAEGLLNAKLKLWMMAEGAVMQRIAE